jgi:hypothetical protein
MHYKITEAQRVLLNKSLMGMPKKGDAAKALEVLQGLLYQPEGEPVACLVGMKGGMFDLPTTKRAYTYAEQPDNVNAYKLGRACEVANHRSAGDGIDRGLALLQELQTEGFGVFDIGAEYITHPPAPRKITSEDVTDEMVDAYFKGTDFDYREHDLINTTKLALASVVNACLGAEG